MWGAPCADAPDVEVAGGDAELRAAVQRHPGSLIRFHGDATSQIARCVGISGVGISGGTRATTGIAVPMDALRLDDDRLALNMVIVGRPPGQLRWWSRQFNFGDPWRTGEAIVIGNGQFHKGLDLVPRGHPGDGRAEVHVYRLARGQRAAMVSRLGTGTHVPHPDIEQRSARSVVISAPKAVPIELDGVPAGRVQSVTVSVVANAYRLLL